MSGVQAAAKTLILLFFEREPQVRGVSFRPSPQRPKSWHLNSKFSSPPLTGLAVYVFFFG
jgi:hypothetical protein